MMTDEALTKMVFDRTVLYSGICFDDTEQIRRAQAFVCLLIKRGVLRFVEEQLEFDFSNTDRTNALR